MYPLYLSHYRYTNRITELWILIYDDQLGNQNLAVKVKDFIPNPVQVLKESENGKPVLKIVLAGASGRETYMISQGQVKRVRETVFNFREQPLAGAFNLRYERDSLFFQYDLPLVQMVMATQARDTLEASQDFRPLALRALYSSASLNVVFPEFQKQGKVVVESSDPKVKSESLTALHMEVQTNDQVKELYVYGRKGSVGRASRISIG